MRRVELKKERLDDANKHGVHQANVFDRLPRKVFWDHRGITYSIESSLGVIAKCVGDVIAVIESPFDQSSNSAYLVDVNRVVLFKLPSSHESDRLTYFEILPKLKSVDFLASTPHGDLRITVDTESLKVASVAPFR